MGYPQRYLEARQRCQRRRGPLSVGGIPTQTTRLCPTDTMGFGPSGFSAGHDLTIIQICRVRLAVSRGQIIGDTASFPLLAIWAPKRHSGRQRSVR